MGRYNRPARSARRLPFFVLGFLLASSACTHDAAAPVELRGLELNPDTLVLLAPGDTARITSFAFDAQGRQVGPGELHWRSLSPSVATVDGSGLVQGVAGGTASIVAERAPVADTVLALVRVPAPAGTFARLAAGYYHACALEPGGLASCWGAGRQGQTGYGLWGEGADTGVPVYVASAVRFEQVTAGGAHTCGLTAEGVAYCWGSNQYGELGFATTRTCAPAGACAPAPARVAGNLRFRRISAGDSYTCAVTDALAAYCWGYTVSGRLGTDPASDHTVPAPVRGGLELADVTAGGAHTCGLARDGTVYCWGSGSNGELGRTDLISRSAPTAIDSPLRFGMIDAGTGFTCGLAADGRAYCWGSDGKGGLGDGPATAPPGSVVAVAGGRTFTTLAVGGEHACGLTPDGSAYCWGSDESGDIGDGGPSAGCGATCTSPTLAAGGLRFGSITAGYGFSCGITTDGLAYCWGLNFGGSLGVGTIGGMRSRPTRVTTPLLPG